jgi:FtsP/CotA-like multicopper oxidase with cupredoxin domain
MLAGAIVVDSLGARPDADRVFVLSVAADSATNAGIPVGTNLVMAINGRSWPATERLTATVGDSVHWRIINASQDPHPMHLHGFYFRVDASSALSASPTVQAAPGRMVVTERMPAFSTMSITWTPERAGNWLFHCHFQLHLVPPGPLNIAAEKHLAVRQQAAPDDHANHAMIGMAGLVMSVAVAPRRGDREAAMPDASGRRRLRLVAIQDPNFPDSSPSMRFVLHEGTHRREAGVGFSPPLDLVRGQPVAITVVNQLTTPTAVHWHGMELDSYYDGVAGLSGAGTRLAPIIAPRDSFTALFTPPRAGTFIYHSHVDEPRTHRAGMLGAMIVRNRGDTRDDEHTFFLKASRTVGAIPAIDVNGQANPDTAFIRAGRATRFRIIGLTLTNPNAVVMLTARADSTMATPPDALIQRWTPVAKDGADLPAVLRVQRPATQTVSMGETYDVEVGPQPPGSLRLEVRAGTPAGNLLARVPIVVR